MGDVFIVGAGIHPFGRTPARTGLQQGVYAVRQALAAAGLDWREMQFAYGGSDAAGKADTMVSELGLTGIQFINVANGCATGGSAMFGAYATIKSGEYDLGIAVGFDKHPRRRLRSKAGGVGVARVVWRNRSDADDTILCHEDPAVHGDVRHHDAYASGSR